MQDFQTVTGMILKCAPVGENDRRVVILTKEKGKIGAFARGARKPTSRFVASTDPFCFGTFKLYEGRDSYNMAEADIQNYFENLRGDFEGACYGFYFCEVADYYTRENNDESEMLKLLYQSFRALLSERIPDRLVKAVFDIKAMCVNGEFPGFPPKRMYNQSTLYAVDFIQKTPVEKLFTFSVSEEVCDELYRTAGEVLYGVTDRKFKSLEILKTL